MIVIRYKCAINYPGHQLKYEPVLYALNLLGYRINHSSARTHMKGAFHAHGAFVSGAAPPVFKPGRPNQPHIPACDLTSDTRSLLSQLSTCLTTPTMNTSSRQTTQSTRTNTTRKRWRTAVSKRSWSHYWRWSRRRRNAFPPKRATHGSKTSRMRATRSSSARLLKTHAALEPPSLSTMKMTRATLYQWLLRTSTYLFTSRGRKPEPFSGPPSPNKTPTSQRRTATPSARPRSSSTRSSKTAGCKLESETWRLSVSSVKPVPAPLVSATVCDVSFSYIRYSWGAI